MAVVARDRAADASQAEVGQRCERVTPKEIVMGHSAEGAGPHPGLLAWLRQNDIDHELHEHAETFTAQATARAEGVDPRTFGKVVGVRTDDGRRALVVLDAPDHLDLRKARGVLEAHDVRLLSEEELADLAPGCEKGALPAVGALFDVPLYADRAIAEASEISFNAGSHRHAVRVDRSAWEGAAGVMYADLAEVRDVRPVWDRG
jgi:Ala-tRNA(Pro) deacylase